MGKLMSHIIASYRRLLSPTNQTAYMEKLLGNLFGLAFALAVNCIRCRRKYDVGNVLESEPELDNTKCALFGFIQFRVVLCP